MDEAEIGELKVECEKLFSLSEWLPSAAKRAGQISMSTHPCTFSHPSARKNKNGYVTSIILEKKFVSDGFLKTGSVEVETDALGNAAALDVYKFLTLVLTDGQQILSHIQQNSEVAEKLLTIDAVSYEELKAGFIAMVGTNDENITSSKIKQIYFPVESDYHQLSILTNSGLIYKLRARIDEIRFSEDAKELRVLKRNNEYSEKSFSEIYGLTTIGYGGTKPQNISVLNNGNGGKTHLLNSLPPQVEKRLINFPKTNFFTESFRYRDCRDIFQALHKIFKTDYSNINIRDGRDYRLQELMGRIIDKMWSIRSAEKDQYYPESSQLQKHQKIWLCSEYTKEREESDQWLDQLCKEVTRWMVQTYEKIMGKQAIKLGEEERLKFFEVVVANKEGLR